ncbi:wall-associated receptor kinase-like 20 [Ziziphus jujuba]|uniref:Wall-associated receptor kinase-like 20 n=1 Tax=Ziziphus jujuba TaxID=326968 RepID=A0ABM3I2Y1_ZIZJJ|nr:wall-associated receptor kinase-like 20 [Ziziphus jujuba]
MEMNKIPIHLLILMCLTGLASAKRCPDCGLTRVPYPLSTGPDCGDPQYKVRCNAGTLWFDTLNGSSYVITSINQLNQRFVIRPPGLADNKTCMAADFGSQGIILDDNLPFNITSSNTVVGMNCSSHVLQLSVNCTSSSPCHDYIKQNVVANRACGSLPFCCFFKTGGSINAYRIRVRKERCSAYESFVNLDASLPVNKWPEPGVEIEWALPEEPICKSSVDCRDLVNSVCLPYNGNRRCLCKTGYQWDPINGICQYLKCQNGRVCKKRKSKAPLIGGSVLSVGAMLMGVITWLIVYKRRERSKREAQLSISKAREDILKANNSGKSAKIFTRREITRATNNFSRQNLIGSGGFGEVFKGNLEDGTAIAAKRAKHGNIKGIHQIINEVRILCQVNHRSLVRLLGCCIELEQPILIYEYIPNGNLFEHLHGNQKYASFLSWIDRLRIAHQTAEGLAYLHYSSVPRIYHRDVKSSNILLDGKLDAKVSDFGLSRLAVAESASHITTCAQGTLGYLDPEYYLNFQLTDKSDVYSFGVVMLELLSSKKAIDFNRDEEDVNLVVYMKRVLREERLMDAVDPVIKDGASNIELETMKALGSLAAACLDERRHNRPSMKQVADEIEYIISILSTGTEISTT